MLLSQIASEKTHRGMGQTRTDSNQQIAAKKRGAEHRRCPECKRGNALSDMSIPDVQSARQCRYCGYADGYIYDPGVPFTEHGSEWDALVTERLGESRGS